VKKKGSEMDNHQHKPRFYQMLQSDKADRERAAILDEWLGEQSELIRNQVTYWLACLGEAGLTETCAKSMLASLIILVSAEPTEQERMVVHGEAVRSAYEWSLVKKGEAAALS
jgi:hypothetical protein